MKTRELRLVMALAIALIALGAIAGFGVSGLVAQRADGSANARAAPLEVVNSAGAGEATTTQADPLILSYPAKFVCLAPLPPGQFWLGPTVPILEEKTEVLIHNSQPYTVTFYKKAVRARVEDAPEIAPGAWVSVTLKPDHAIRVDCDDIAFLLTGNKLGFSGNYGPGVKVEGFVVIAVGPQTVGNRLTFGSLDVTAEYNKGSEVLKKDISYQPWWIWWWWRDTLPWRLGYAYQRILPIIDPARNIDCRGTLYGALIQDTQQMTDTLQRDLTIQALNMGRQIEPANPPRGEQDAPALVALIGGCDKIDATAASVDYVLVSNKTCTDADPRTPGTLGQCPGGLSTNIVYPWWPGRWYDLTVVVPQNVSIDLDGYIRQWHTDLWIAAKVPTATVQAAMVYYFPWWCGWGYWWWWWWGDDCIDIAVGEGESIDVEQIVPTRVFMPVWPPK